MGHNKQRSHRPAFEKTQNAPSWPSLILPLNGSQCSSCWCQDHPRPWRRHSTSHPASMPSQRWIEILSTITTWRPNPCPYISPSTDISIQVIGYIRWHVIRWIAGPFAVLLQFHGTSRTVFHLWGMSWPRIPTKTASRRPAAASPSRTYETWWNLPFPGAPQSQLSPTTTVVDISQWIQLILIGEGRRQQR